VFYIHADDYGVSAHASEDILSLISSDCLDGISIMPNMSCFDKSMQRLCEGLAELSKEISVSVHLNFMEGHCVAKPEEIPLLVNGKGLLFRSWGELFAASFSSKRDAYKKQLKIEIKAQMAQVRNYFPAERVFRVDSHQHTHLIPVVWDAMVEVLQEEGIPISGVRIPVEPIVPFLHVPSLYTSYGLVNLIKNMVLHILAHRAKRVAPEYFKDDSKFWGLLMTGQMDDRRVQMLMPHFKKYAEKHHINIEMVFHPGLTLPEEISEEYTKEGFIEEHLSPNRRMEWETIKALKKGA